MYWLGYLILIGLPLSFAILCFSKAAAWQQDFADRVLRCSISTTAQVIGTAEETIVDKQGGTRSVWFHPVVRFTVQEKEFQVRCEERWNPLPFKMGDSLTIWYNSSDPEDIHLEGEYCCRGRNYITPMAMGLMSGVIAVGCAVFCAWYAL